jgi:hypothetical protein
MVDRAVAPSHLDLDSTPLELDSTSMARSGGAGLQWCSAPAELDGLELVEDREQREESRQSRADEVGGGDRARKRVGAAATAVVKRKGREGGNFTFRQHMVISFYYATYQTRAHQSRIFLSILANTSSLCCVRHA